MSGKTGYQLSASNIGWEKKDDARVIARMKELGYKGLEVAPTRLFPDTPYEHRNMAAMLSIAMRREFDFSIPSMQSIWFGVEGNIFTPAAKLPLLEKTNAAFTFAHAMGCHNLVFGCPRARNIPDGHTAEEADDFFRQAARIAHSYDSKLAMEANPPIYNTNFLNTTREAFDFVRRLAEPGLSVNLDVGTMVYNGENPADFANDLDLVSHVHISEPYLAPIEKRELHKELAEILKEKQYQGFVSVEMKCADYETVEKCLEYVAEVFL